MDIDPVTRGKILEFVDLLVPAGAQSVWLTGSRVRGTARADSDWDVIVFHPDAPSSDKDLFEHNQDKTGPSIDGGQIELIIAHPRHWNDPRPYMVECRALGIRLR